MARKRKPTTIPTKKDVLRQAREIRGLSVQKAAELIGVSPQHLEAIEQGQFPTASVFDKMVRVYKQSESILLLERLPVTQLPKDYRTEAGRRARLSPDTRLAIRQAQELQSYVSDLVEDRPSLINPRLQLATATTNDSAETQARWHRELFDVSLSTQLGWSVADSFSNWRDLLESKGFLVLLKKMPWNDCRGFSLLGDHNLPTIVVNSEDIPIAQNFTLFHEYAHHILRNAGICVFAPASKVERWCNAFAAEFLVPSDAFIEHIKRVNPQASSTYDWPLTRIAYLASYYRVSRSVIALRLQHLALAIPDYYDKHRGALVPPDQRRKPKTAPKIKKKPGWKEKQKLKEVGIRAASVIVGAWRERIADATEAADILNLSLSELHGLQKQTEVQRVRNVG
jgi:Zn-dependent peptidase ImmA (M78 family)/ribosome-binding protein aMBF1 (putative translation factor)